MRDEALKNGAREVVVVLPYLERNVLLQLRDVKPDIDYPDHWGFFGGTVEADESPEQSAVRELSEELGFRPEKVHRISTDYFPKFHNLLSHSYFCKITMPVSNMVLTEGQDLGLFSLEQIESRKLFSGRLKRELPVVPTTYIAGSVRRLWDIIDGKNPV